MSIQLASKYDSSQPYHIYYDIDLINNDNTGTKPPVQLRFNEIRNSPYLMSPENYFMSVARFSIQTPTLPCFIPSVSIGQTNVNKLVYSFTMSYKVGNATIECQQYINYIPFDNTQPIPNPPLTFQDLTSDYYFVQSYQHWAFMMNQSLIECFNGLKNAVINAGGTLPTENCPFMEFDPQSLLFILDCDQVGFDRSLTNPIKLFCNSPLQTLLSSFQFTKLGYSNIVNGKNFQFDIYNINDTNILTLPTYNAIQMYQEGSTCGLMNPIQSLVFTTALLPVVQGLVSVPKIFNSDSNLFNVGNNSNIIPMLTDFTVPFSPTNTYKPTVEYTPNGEYRFVDLFGTSPLSAIEISVFWKDIFGSLHPFYLGSRCSSNIKLMFRRKDFGNITL
jgi:hypothetical protein